METEKCLLVLHSKLPKIFLRGKKKKKNNWKVILSKTSEAYSLPGIVIRTKQQEHTQQPSHVGKDK